MLDFSIVAGNGVTLEIKITDPNGSKIDFTLDRYEVADISFALKDDVDSDVARVTKSLGNGIEIDADDGIIKVTLDSIDTDLEASIYVFDCAVEFADGTSVSVRSDKDMNYGMVSIVSKIASF